MGESPARVLVVDDESSLRRVLRITLSAVGFAVADEANGELAIARLQVEPFDVALLDVNMPGMGGIAACRLLRQQHPRLGILMLTVRSGYRDRVEALEAGADDYVVKPFHLGELVARLHALVRRAHRMAPGEAPAGGERPIRIGELELNRQNRSLTISGEPTHLTPNEFALLYCLMSRAGELVSHKEIFRSVWGGEENGDAECLRSLVRQVRRKIEPRPAEPIYLLSAPGFGYRFRAG